MFFPPVPARHAQFLFQRRLVLDAFCNCFFFFFFIIVLESLSVKFADFTEFFITY
jgi:hypothetical protein